MSRTSVTKNFSMVWANIYTADYETMTIKARKHLVYDYQSVDEVCKLWNGIKIEVLENTRRDVVYAMDSEKFMDLGKIIDSTDRRNKVTRTIKVTDYTGYEMDIESMSIKEVHFKEDARLTTKEVAKKHANCGKIVKGETKEVLVGMNYDTFIANSEIIER